MEGRGWEGRGNEGGEREGEEKKKRKGGWKGKGGGEEVL